MKGIMDEDKETSALDGDLNDAIRHFGEGRMPQAEETCRKILADDPDHPTALNLLGAIVSAAGETDRAVEFVSRAIAVKPDYAEAHNNLGNLLRNLGRLAEAEESYLRALNLKPEYAEAHNNLGVTLLALGRPQNAAASFRQAIIVNPNLAEAHNHLGSTLQMLGQMDEAVASFHKSLAIRPDCAEVHNNLGVGLKELGKLDEAIASYHEALAIKPDFAEAHGNLCGVLETTNNTEALREAVNNALQTCSGDPIIALREAELLKRDGDFEAAQAVLEATDEKIADARFLAAREGLLGELCDRQGDAEAAYNYFREANRQYRDTPEAKLIDGKKYLGRIDILEKRFTADWIAGWRRLESDNDRSDPVFLVGFPRSGTTLLDTILRSHPAISVVEEQPIVEKTQKALERLPGGYPDGLAELEPAQLATLRQIYFAELDEHLEPEDSSAIVVDKLPLNIIHAGLIHRIFPKARFVFAQRHPCDCVLSCFMQKFRINEAMANFLDLEDAARMYDKVMTLWQQYQTVLPLEAHTVRYESLIEAFDETLTPLFDFLGVDWDDNVRNYTETAHRRGRIVTPSYNQVTQPLYTRARGRWERYREHMRPVLPTLLPWARRYGYDE